MSEYLKFSAVFVAMICLPFLAKADTTTQLNIAPRWDAVWLSPQLNTNWVVLRYQHNFEKGKDPSGTITIDLPEGVSLVAALWGKHRKINLPEGKTRHEIDVVRVTTGSGNGSPLYYLALSTTLQPGTETECKISAVWQGGEMLPRTFPIKIIEVTFGRQPKEILTGAAIWPYQISSWADFYKQYASLGFNHINYWEGTIHHTETVNEKLKEQAELARREGINMSVDASHSWDSEKLEATPDAQAIYASSGKKYKEIPCPSYRGPAFLEKMKFNAEIAKSGISHIQSDEELYTNTGAGTNTCICSRCEAGWKEWLPKHYPELDYLPPKEVITRRADHPELHRAWSWFMASLTTERYQIYKREIEKAVQEYGAGSSPGPLLSWWAGAAEYSTLERSQQDARSLSQTIDYLFPQLYFRYKIRLRHFREAVRRHSWAVDGKGFCAGIDTDDGFEDANTPGILATAVLETLFAGGKGYCLWYGPYMDTRQWAELGQVNDVIAKHEQTFLEGKETNLFRSYAPITVEGLPKFYFQPWSPDVCTTTWENETEGMLLVTDYRKTRTPIWVERSLKYSGQMTLYDAFTDEKVVHLTEGRWDFRIHLEESPEMLLFWKK